MKGGPRCQDHLAAGRSDTLGLAECLDLDHGDRTRFAGTAPLIFSRVEARISTRLLVMPDLRKQLLTDII